MVKRDTTGRILHAFLDSFPWYFFSGDGSDESYVEHRHPQSMGETRSLCLQTSPRKQAQNCAWINVEHSVVALRSKLDVKFH